MVSKHKYLIAHHLDYTSILSFQRQRIFRIMVKIAVIGAGANGLASAVKIKEAYKDVEVVIISNELTPDTTGDGSGGLWNPHLCGDTPEQLLQKWGSATFKLYFKLWLEGGYNICLLPIYDFDLQSDEQRQPEWAKEVLGFRPFSKEQLKYYSKLYNNEFKSGATFSTFVAHPSSILQYLTERFKQANGKILRAKVNSLFDPLLDGYDIVVNCAGLGSRNIVPDSTVFPVRGQILKVSAPWATEVIIDNTGHYIIPNYKSCVLGGTHQENNYNTEIDVVDTKNIINGCTTMIQGLKNAQVVDTWVGLRPARRAIRLEPEKKGDKLIIHNYGHGGSGLTLFWGCAENVLEILKEKLPGGIKSKL